MRYLASILLLAMLACAQTPAKPKPSDKPSDTLLTGGSGTIMFQAGPPEPLISIGGTDIIEIKDAQGKLMIRIDRDGHSTLGDGYHPDAGAKLFWEALARYYPLVCAPLPKPATMPAKEGQPK